MNKTISSCWTAAGCSGLLLSCSRLPWANPSADLMPKTLKFLLKYWYSNKKTLKKY